MEELSRDDTQPCGIRRLRLRHYQAQLTQVLGHAVGLGIEGPAGELGLGIDCLRSSRAQSFSGHDTGGSYSYNSPNMLKILLFVSSSARTKTWAEMPGKRVSKGFCWSQQGSSEPCTADLCSPRHLAC